MTDDTEDLIARTQDLPPELFDQIKHYVFTSTTKNINVNKESFEFPTALQANHATRVQFAKSYFESNRFVFHDVMDIPRLLGVLPLELFKTLQIVIISQVGQLRCTDEEQLFTEDLDDHIREACRRSKRGVKKISIEWYSGELVSALIEQSCPNFI